MIGVEAGGRGVGLGEHAARFDGGTEGVFQGTRSFVLQNDDGQVVGTHSVSAGLDYPSVGPEHAWLQSIGRAKYIRCSDEQALEAQSPQKVVVKICGIAQHLPCLPDLKRTTICAVQPLSKTLIPCWCKASDEITDVRS